MDNNQVTELLTDYKSYKYALRNVGMWDTGLPLIVADRIKDLNVWDATRYSRIVGMIEGAVNELLTDGQRMVIMRMYLDRHTVSMSVIADMESRDRGTISRWHKEALRRLRKALAPLNAEEKEISNLDEWMEKKSISA